MRALPSYAEVLALPQASPLTVPAAYGDGNGHLNVRHYVGILDDAEWALFDEFGAGTAASQAGLGGMFALEAHLTYRREVLVGDEVAVHLRILERTPKLIHLVSYLLNRSRGEVSASMEALEAYVDYDSRRVAPFPAAAADALDAVIERNRALPWRPELSGSIALPAPS